MDVIVIMERLPGIYWFYRNFDRMKFDDFDKIACTDLKEFLDHLTLFGAWFSSCCVTLIEM